MGGSAVWGYACGINSASQSVAAHFCALLNQTIANSPTFSNNPETITLATVPASSTSILLTKQRNSSEWYITFSSVTASGMVINWPDWATEN